MTIDSAFVADIKVTASFGVACYPQHATDVESLKEAADRALYDAKQRGRNCVRVCGEPPPAAPGPRETPCRQPKPGALTEEQGEKMRQDYFRGTRIKCPMDGAFLNVEDVTTMGSVGRNLYVTCPICGLSEQLPGPRS